MVKNYIRKIFNKLKPAKPIKDKKKKDDINKEKEYIISLIELELDEKTFAILKDKLFEMTYEELCEFLEHLYDKREDDDKDTCDHIDEINKLENKIKKKNKEIKDLKKVTDKLIEENNEEDEQIKKLKKKIKKLKNKIKEMEEGDNDYNVEDTDFYQKALDRVESAIHILQKIEGAGYSHESAEEISKRIVLFALKSADDTNDK